MSMSHLSSFILLLLPALAWPQCSLLSVSDCHFNPDEVKLTLTSDHTQYLSTQYQDISTQYLDISTQVILTLPLPSDQPEPAALCQQLCGVQDECDFWHYDGAVFSCRY